MLLLLMHARCYHASSSSSSSSSATNSRFYDVLRGSVQSSARVENSNWSSTRPTLRSRARTCMQRTSTHGMRSPLHYAAFPTCARRRIKHRQAERTSARAHAASVKRRPPRNYLLVSASRFVEKQIKRANFRLDST